MTALQAELLKLLKELDAVCRKYDIKYYLYGGTALGALRHRGFIPWDDDADIIMTRDNAEKLLNVPKEEFPKGRMFLHSGNCDTPGFTNTLYMNTETSQFFRYHTMYHNPAGIMIDVDILDPVSDDPKQQLRHIQALTAHTEVLSEAYHYNHRNGWDIPEDLREKRKKLSRDEFLKETYREFASYPEEECNFFISRWAGVPHLYPKSVIGEPRYVQFEDTYLPVCEKNEEFLKKQYMDEWLNIPPISDRSLHMDVQNDFVGYEVYYKDFKNTVPKEKIVALNKERNRMLDEYKLGLWKIWPEKMTFEGIKLKNELDKKLKSGGYNLRSLIDSRNYEKLEELLAGYLAVQCSATCIGNVTYVGWVRRNHPILLEQTDDVTEAIVLIMLHQGRISKAGRVLLAKRMTGKPLTEAQEQLCQLIEAIRLSTSAYFEGDYEKVEEICDKWLKLYPDNPDLLKAKCSVLYKDEHRFDEFEKSLEASLDYHPKDDVLNYMRAKVLYKNGDIKDADEILMEYALKADNGYIVMHIKDDMFKRLESNSNDETAALILRDAMTRSGLLKEDICAEIGKIAPSIELYKDAEQDTEENKAVNIEQSVAELAEGTAAAVSFKLLKEIDTICRKNSIQYYLSGSTALAAYRDHVLPDNFVAGSVLMTAENCIKFMAAFEKERPEGRRLDSLKTNPNFPGVYLRYSDDGSLLFTVNNYWCYDGLGISVGIHIMRGYGNSKILGKILNMFEVGIESQDAMPWYSRKRYAVKTAVKTIRTVLGKRLVGKTAFDVVVGNSKRGIGSKYLVKRKWKESLGLPIEFFETSNEARLYGHSFSIAGKTEEYLEHVLGKKWMERIIPEHKEGISTIVDASMPWKKYLDMLPAELLQRFPDEWKSFQLNRMKVDWYNSKIAKYWDIILRTHDRIVAAMFYLPEKERIMQLHRNGNAEELSEILKPYIRLIKVNADRELSMNIDEELFSVAVEVMNSNGWKRLARKAVKLSQNEAHPFADLELSGAKLEEGRVWAEEILFSKQQ